MQEEGTHIGPYKLLKKIGEGSYGIVYKATDPSADRIVALKKIKIDSDEEGMPVHCVREIAILKKVCHPNIVRLFDILYFAADRRLVLAFEYVDKSLSQMLDDKPNTPMNPYVCKVDLSHEESDAPTPKSSSLSSLQSSHSSRHQARQHPGPKSNCGPQTCRLWVSQAVVHSSLTTDSTGSNSLVQISRTHSRGQHLLIRGGHLGISLRFL